MTPARRWRLVLARRDAVPTSVRRFSQRVRQRRLRAAVPWAIALAVLLVAGLVTWGVYGTGVLGLRRVTVQGAEIVTPDQVREAAALRPGTPLARVHVDAVRRRVADLAPVGRATVTLVWPHTVRITVVEREPVATVPKDTTFLLVDAGGVVFHTVDRRPVGLPVVRLANPGPDEPTTRAALRVLAALTPVLRDSLAELVAEAPARIRLVLRDKRIVVWGDATENETKAQVATALLARPGTRIDVSAPEVVTVR